MLSRLGNGEKKLERKEVRNLADYIQCMIERKRQRPFIYTNSNSSIGIRSRKERKAWKKI